MFNSVRARLAVGYVAVWTVILILCAGGFYLFRQHTLNVELDASLARTIDVVHQSTKYEVEEEDDQQQGDEILGGVILLEHQKDFPLQAVSAFTGDRLIVQKAGESDLNISSISGLGDGSVPFLSLPWNGAEVRVSQRIIQLPRHPTKYRIVVAQSRSSVEVLLRRARMWLTALVTIALIISSTFGYFLARACLRPVVQMAKAVERLDAQMEARRSGHPDAKPFTFALPPAEFSADARMFAEGLPLLDSKDELGYLANTFRRLLERQYLASEQQRQFMADASHELKTPLSISLITTQVALEKDRSADEYRDALKTAYTQIDRLSRLVQDMFLLARSDASGFLLRSQRCDLTDILLEATNAANVLARQKGVALHLPDTIPQIDSPIDADPEMVQQLILILLDNAIKYSAAHTTIQLHLQSVGGFYEIRVQDEGCGIPADVTHRIFDRFFRVEQARSQSTGSGAGLGLPIARWIANLHEGTVELVETSPQGTIFAIRLPKPRSRPNREEDHRGGEAASQAAARV